MLGEPSPEPVRISPARRRSRKGQAGAAFGSSDAPPRPPGDRPRPRVAPRGEGFWPHRLSARPVGRNPTGPDRQAPRRRPRPRHADLGPHVPLPVRPPRVELRPVVAGPAARRLRCRDPSPARRNVGGTGSRLVSPPGLGLPSDGIPPGGVDRRSPAQPSRAGRGNHRDHHPPRLRLAPRPFLLEGPARVPGPEGLVTRVGESTLNKVALPSPGRLFPRPLFDPRPTPSPCRTP